MVINKHQNYENVYELPVPHESDTGSFYVDEKEVLADVIDLFYRDVIYIDEYRQQKVAERETNQQYTLFDL